MNTQWKEGWRPHEAKMLAHWIGAEEECGCGGRKRNREDVREDDE